MVQQFMKDLENEKESDNNNNVTCGQSEQQVEPHLLDGNALTIHLSRLFSEMEPLKSTEFYVDHLSPICYNVLNWGKNRLSGELEIYPLKVFSFTTTGGKPNLKSILNNTLARRSARRKEHALTQRAWKKNPCNCVRKILQDETTLSYHGVWSISSASDLVDMAIIKKKEHKIVSTRFLAEGLNAFWMFNRVTSCKRLGNAVGC